MTVRRRANHQVPELRPSGRWDMRRAVRLWGLERQRALRLWWAEKKDSWSTTATKHAVATGLTLSLGLFLAGVRPVMSQVHPAGHVQWAQVLAGQAVASIPKELPTVAASVTPAAPASVASASAANIAPASTASVAPAPPAANLPTATAPAAAGSGTSPSVSAPTAAAKSEAELYGDQLQALTSMYETIITVLAVGLGLLATAAFAAIRYASQRETELIAREVLRGAEYKAHVAEMIEEAVGAHLDSFDEDIRDLQNAVDALQADNETVTPPPGASSPGTPPGPAPVQPPPSPGQVNPAQGNAAASAGSASPPPAASPPIPAPPPPAPPATTPPTVPLEPPTLESHPNPAPPSGNGD